MSTERFRARNGGLVARDLAVAVLGLGFLACSNANERAGSFGGGPAPEREASSRSGSSCEVHAVQSCYVTVSANERELACYEGTRQCIDGIWGPCEDGTVVRREAPSAWSRRPGANWLAFTLPERCGIDENPCNPDCYRYAEAPPEGPLVPDLDEGSGLSGGSPSSAPEQDGCYWGNDCQYNHYCEGPLTAPDCAHSKCEQGPALVSEACRVEDPCVAAICEARPSCCAAGSAGWDATCVGMVKSVCDAFCDVRPTPCEHHFCSKGSALTCTDPCVLAVCAQEPACCETYWDTRCVELTTTTSECSPVTSSATVPSLGGFAELCGYAAYSDTNLEIGQRAKVHGRIGARGNLTVTSANLFGVDLTVGGDLKLDNSNVLGTATVAGNVELANDADFGPPFVPSPPPVLVAGQLDDPETTADESTSVTVADPTGRLWGEVISPHPPIGPGQMSGSWTELTESVVTSTPSLSAPAPSACANSGTAPDVIVNAGMSHSLAPGDYGDVSVNGTLTLTDSGSYTFNSLTLNSTSRLEIATYEPAGIDLHLCQAATLAPHIDVSPAPVPFTELRWFFYPDTTWNIDVQSAIAGVFIAPNGRIDVAPNTELNGVVYAHGMKFEPGINNLRSNYGATMCHATGGPRCNMGARPTSPPAPVETGTCTPWPAGEVDETCASFDVALGMPCAGSLLVCNHGTEPAPSGIELALFDPSYEIGTLDPIADATLTSAYVGSCETTTPIPAGSCINQRCAQGLLDRPVNAVAIAPIEECSALENWTAYDPAVECECLPSVLLDAALDEATCSLLFGEVAGDEITRLTAIEASDGSAYVIPRAASASECTSHSYAWYPDGEQVVLCPNTCPTGLAFDGYYVAEGECIESAYQSTVFVQHYYAECEEGRTPQWDLLTWASTTPGNSSIRFEVRTAPTEEALVDFPFEMAGTASAAQDEEGQDTQRCDAFSQHPDCPALIALLATEADAPWELRQIRYRHLELRIELTPATNTIGLLGAPELRDWEIHYSCLESE